MDSDDLDSHVFRLAYGDGDSDNHLFYIVDDRIVIRQTPDYEDQTSFSIRVSAADDNNLLLKRSSNLI